MKASDVGLIIKVNCTINFNPHEHEFILMDLVIINHFNTYIVQLQMIFIYFFFFYFILILNYIDVYFKYIIYI